MPTRLRTRISEHITAGLKGEPNFVTMYWSFKFINLLNSVIYIYLQDHEEQSSYFKIDKDAPLSVLITEVDWFNTTFCCHRASKLTQVCSVKLSKAALWLFQAAIICVSILNMDQMRMWIAKVLCGVF